MRTKPIAATACTSNVTFCKKSIVAEAEPLAWCVNVNDASINRHPAARGDRMPRLGDLLHGGRNVEELTGREVDDHPGAPD